MTTTTTYIMSPKKATTTGSIHRILDTNQGDETLLREARNQKRKAISPEPQDKELEQEIDNLEAMHQRLEKRGEKVLHLSDLQKKIDEASEEKRNIEASVAGLIRLQGSHFGCFVMKTRATQQ
jgi:hypothetical protein